MWHTQTERLESIMNDRFWDQRGVGLRENANVEDLVVMTETIHPGRYTVFHRFNDQRNGLWKEMTNGAGDVLGGGSVVSPQYVSSASIKSHTHTCTSVSSHALTECAA